MRHLSSPVNLRIPHGTPPAWILVVDDDQDLRAVMVMALPKPVLGPDTLRQRVRRLLEQR